jgi:hypothetical protein
MVMNKLTVATRLIAVGVFVGGCGSSPTATPGRGPSKATAIVACSSPKTAYLFPGGTMIGQGENSNWLRLSLYPASRSAVVHDQLVEAVVPSDAAWTVIDLRISPRDGKRISQSWQEAMDKYPDGEKVLSAKVCFHSWSKASVLEMSVVTGANAQRAQHLTRGMYAASPSVLKPGGSFFVAVFEGSWDGMIYSNMRANPNIAWYAVNVTAPKIYPVSLAQFASSGNLDIYEFVLSEHIPTGSYTLAPLTAERAANVGPGFMNGATDGDFTFQVQ